MENSLSDTVLLSGTSHPAFAKEIADQLGIPVGRVAIDRFPDGEIQIQILESVRGRNVFVVQSVALHPNEYLLELLILIDALRRASAHQITVVLPYFPYSRQDRKEHPRDPITAKLVADLLTKAGTTRVLTMDLHAGQIEGFFNIPVDNLSARPALARMYQKLFPDATLVVTPDVGSIKLARAYAAELAVDFAVIDKERKGPNEVSVTMVIGDIAGKNVLLTDDMCSTGGTLVKAAEACQNLGAKRIFAAVTHGLFVGNAIPLLEKSPIEKILVSNTLPQGDRTKSLAKKEVISVAPLFAEAIECILHDASISTRYSLSKSQNPRLV